MSTSETDSRRIVASQEMGTRTVMEAHIEGDVLAASQNSGGPLNVTKILAAVTGDLR